MKSLLAVGIFAGYLHLPQKTKAAFTADGWFRTGDLDYFDRDHYLHIAGRHSTLIKTESGEKVQTEDLEDAFSNAEGIREIGILEDKGKIVALVVPISAADGQQDNSSDSFQQNSAKIEKALEARSHQLPSHQRISEFRVTYDPLPRTRLGKIRREELVERYQQAGRKDGGPKSRAQRQPISVEQMADEDRMLLDDEVARDVWKLLTEQFADQPLTPDSNLQLELSIDSLEWMNLSFAMAERSGVELDEDALAGVEKVRDLLQAASESGSGGGQVRPEDVFDRPEEFLSDRQRRWLEALGPVERQIAAGGYNWNRKLVHTFFGLDVQGLEHFPEHPPYVIAPNHASYLDPLVVAASLPANRLERLWWTAWTGINFANPLLRLVSRLTHSVPVEPKHGARSSLAFAAAILRRDDPLVWFPEGGLSPNGRIQPFKRGLRMLLEHFHVPTVPVFIGGTFEAMPAGHLWPHRHRLSITFGEPINSNELRGQQSGGQVPKRIMRALRRRVQELQHDSKAPTPFIATENRSAQQQTTARGNRESVPEPHHTR